MFTLINLQWQMPQFSSPCCPSKCLIFIRYLTQSVLTMAGGNEGWLLRAVDMLHVRWPGEPWNNVTSITLEHFVSSHLSWYSSNFNSRQGGLPMPTGKHKICWPETWAIINLQNLNPLVPKSKSNLSRHLSILLIYRQYNNRVIKSIYSQRQFVYHHSSNAMLKMYY